MNLTVPETAQAGGWDGGPPEPGHYGILGFPLWLPLQTEQTWAVPLKSYMGKQIFQPNSGPGPGPVGSGEGPCK